MKKAYLTIAAFLALWPAASMAQGFAGVDPKAQSMEARLNTDNYPYSVLARGPILPPEEQRKLREYWIREKQNAEAREYDKVRQFKTMSADERRYVIETQGFPRAMLPGYK